MKAILALSFLGITCLAQSEQQPLLSSTYDPLNKDFAAYVHSVIDHFHVPSVTIAVIRNGTVYSGGYGTAVFPDTPAKAETLYFVGSTTKSFTAAALTLLMDDAQNTSSAFAWNTPVVDFIREDFVLSDEYITTHATLEDLASHRTGFPRHDLSYGSKGQETVRDTVRNMRDLPFTAGFREKWQYCNYMWATLGHVAELVSGKNLGDFLRERLWHRIGMNGTYWTLEDAQAAAKNAGRELSRGYTWDEATQKFYEDPYMNIGPLAAAGSIISNVLDYAEYLRMMLHRSGPVSEEGHTQLRRARSFEVVDTSRYGSVVGYGLGWDVTPYRGINLRGHNGGLPGYGALMVYVPERDFGIAMLANAAGTGNFVEEVIKNRLLDDLLGTPESERYDWMKHYDDALLEAEVKLNTTRTRVFGGKKQDPPKPATLPLESYQGSYWSDGYKGIELKISQPSPTIPGFDVSKKHVLAAEWPRVWPGHWELEHISGEFFVAWMLNTKTSLESDGDVYESVESGFAAEFRIGSDGKPSELGIALEPSMEGEKIWFKRV